ncbi:hypothetical protein B1R32_11549 [Abditibacterium utsteinense]|uniref:Uncharacterized protein n=1 Tax=Abditibacterium utsteinense TaxID=1960156 RepID=A0A2S8SQQ9_9BACT|nr:hypothetical protein B1R32_11549 [Abditibacterium utsteinense]
MKRSTFQFLKVNPPTPEVQRERFLLILDSILIVFSVVFSAWILVAGNSLSYLWFNLYILLGCMQRHVKKQSQRWLLLFLSITCMIVWMCLIF